MVVNPVHAGLSKEAVKDREALLALAKVGREMQKWTNTTMGLNEDEEFVPRSNSEMSLSSIASEESSSRDESRSSATPPSAHPANLSAGENELLRLFELLFKTDGPLLPQHKPEPEEVQARRRKLVVWVD